MIGSFLKMAIQAAKEMPWWKKALVGGANVLVVGAVALTRSAGTELGKKTVGKILKDKKMTVEKKLEKLKELRDKGVITEDEYQEARKLVIKNFAQEK